ncbi:MAG TPA: hypothetical protein DIT64_22190, partial [Verrucomicrobiales bacterium]|nr:hypothetical protein [Verrucomicrobiales bacterium]
MKLKRHPDAFCLKPSRAGCADFFATGLRLLGKGQRQDAASTHPQARLTPPLQRGRHLLQSLGDFSRRRHLQV